MTAVLTHTLPVAVAAGVYTPQQDSHLLINTLQRTTGVSGRTVVDLCTGSGIVAIAAARMGATRVSAWDISARAVQCTRDNAAAAGVLVDARLGPIDRAVAHGPYDVVVSNPPYVPTPPHTGGEVIPAHAGPAWAWDAGRDGRLILDQLCAYASDLLTIDGTLLLAQSEFAGIDQTVHCLRSAGLSADVVASQVIPFGPVMHARAGWLEGTGLLDLDRRDERIAVIRATKPRHPGVRPSATT
ncbi:methyltransferase [Mycolicibacterium hodleri]|uniref:Methyltransferase domain-containing protein n=1 Tax=Mycolicibacterium hodleri TaxID=49897 RepID=A0A502DRM3_9MYCO|nr:methyltransferase [Mycolicibacterium hodleri]TPG28085.1 methyltransferase domain-containing protein [Mycolicibacterium hodleri]